MRKEGRGMTGVRGSARRRGQGRRMRDERIDRREEGRGGRGKGMRDEGMIYRRDEE